MFDFEWIGSCDSSLSSGEAKFTFEDEIIVLPMASFKIAFQLSEAFFKEGQRQYGDGKDDLKKRIKLL